MPYCLGVCDVRAEERVLCGRRGADSAAGGKQSAVHSTEMAGGRFGRDWLESVLTSYYLFIEQYQAADHPGSFSSYFYSLNVTTSNFMAYITSRHHLPTVSTLKSKPNN